MTNKPIVVGALILVILFSASPIAKPTHINQSTMLLHRQGNSLVDQNGNQVILRGTQTGGFVDGPNGNWQTQQGFMFSGYGWNPDYVTELLDTMKQWKFNNLRLHLSVELWLNDVGNTREHVKSTIEQANQKGIYVTISPWSIRYYGQPGFMQNAYPYPPYNGQDYETGSQIDEASIIIPSKQAYIDFYGQLVNDLKGYPNILWEIWNEPHGDIFGGEEARADYFANVVNPIIINGRKQGARQPFIIASDWGGIRISNFDSYVKNIPDQNIALSMHVYAFYGHFSGATYEQIKNELETSGLMETGETHPIYLGEIGINIDNPADYTRYDNFLRLVYEEGWSWATWWLRSWGGTFSFVNSNFSPNQAGLVYQKWLNMYAYQPLQLFYFV